MSDEYRPSPEVEERISEVRRDFDQARQIRQSYEPQWFLNAAFFRGQQYAEWSARDSRLTVPDAPSHRVRIRTNRVLPKIKARRAKYLRGRPTWVVVPATTDHEDKRDARATQKALDYQWRRCKLEAKQEQALQQSEICGRGYWWFYWDPAISAKVRTPNPMTGETTLTSMELGDVVVEVGSAFEVVVADPGYVSIGEQPWIVRARMRDVASLKGRYPDHAPYIEPTSSSDEIFRYEQQIATLTPSGSTSISAIKDQRRKTHALVIERFDRPTPDYPKGRYSVLIGNVLVKDEFELPYSFWDMDNPYPVVEFIDIPIASQYWSPTMIEQLIDPQREYNLMRSKGAENLRLMAFPKLLTFKQHRIPESAWTSDSGEVIEANWLPGLPPPQPWTPPNVAQDVWQSIALCQREFDDITQIYPATEGRTGSATSGFQTNLLQEAADSVHAPDVRRHERTIEEAAYKVRRLMKLGYDVPRLLTILGKDREPECFEFSSEDINEHSDIIVESGSALPALKFARIEAVTSLYEKGLFGNPSDPEVRNRALSMMEMGSIEEAFDYTRRDIELARQENDAFEKGQPPPHPMFYENHVIHSAEHGDMLKRPRFATAPIGSRLPMIVHLIQHAEYINPQSAAQLAMEFNVPQVLKPQTMQLYQQVMMQQQMMQPPAQQVGTGQAGAAPPGAPPERS